MLALSYSRLHPAASKLSQDGWMHAWMGGWGVGGLTNGRMDGRM